MQILLNKYKSKKSVNTNSLIPITLSGRNKLLPSDNLSTIVNELELYKEERANSSKVRLVCTIKPYCTNVLFNNITEAVKDEGSPNVMVITNPNLDDITIKSLNLVGKSQADYIADFDENIETMITRDTQINNELNGFKYHCGLDIFNNHLLRSKTFKTSSISAHSIKDFNTIFDKLRTSDGQQKKDFSDTFRSNVASKDGDIDMHLYTVDDILTFEECCNEKLIEEKGWFGFTNVGKMLTYDAKNNPLYVNQVINNRKPCDFIDMYPTRDLYSFVPKYNEYRHRVEKNWNYCITYPSSSTTEGISFIDSKTKALKAIYYDDTIKNSDGTNAIKVYSISKHGLKEGDAVNLYNSDTGDEISSMLTVKSVQDEYVFYLYNHSFGLSNAWYSLTLEDRIDKEVTFNDKIYHIDDARTKAESEDGDVLYIVDGKKINFGDVKNISYKKVVNGEEVDYYVRIFSKIPNWRRRAYKPSQAEMYKNNAEVIHEYQAYNFESHISQLAFSQTIYADPVAEITFTDDIDVDGLKDNLNRPLSEIFLTLVKNNKGYKEWYRDMDFGNEHVEYSHAFGKVNCAFRLSKESLPNKEHNNSTVIHNLEDGLRGLDINMIHNNTEVKDDIEFDSNIHYYGDLCMFSPSTMEETSIQMVDHRFNTAQRELTNDDKAFTNWIGDDMYYDEIVSDDYDFDGFKGDVKHIEGAVQCREGYLYQPHYRIPIKSWAKEVTSVIPHMLTIKKIDTDDNRFSFATMEKHFAEVGDVLILKHVDTNGISTCWKVKVVELLDYRRFVAEIIEGGELFSTNRSELIRYKLIKIDDEIPSYAYFVKNGTSQFIWRELYQNGLNPDETNEVYPFLNNALYVHKDINFYLKRQDPNGHAQLARTSFPLPPKARVEHEYNVDQYYSEEEITC